MVPQPEQHAREHIDTLLARAGWRVCDPGQVNLTAARGIAIRKFPLPGHGLADYLLYVDGKAAGVIEAKKEGVTLTGVETQAEKYTKGLPTALPRWRNPLPFSYQSTGIETRFTNGLDPAPRSRPVFAFHKPETLATWLDDAARNPNKASPLPPGEGQGEGARFTPEQTKWLDMIRDFTVLTPPLPSGEGRGEGGLGKVHQLSGTACARNFRMIEHPAQKHAEHSMERKR